MGPDVVVVGAGLGGLSAALVLAARGLRVTVVELAASAGGKAGVEVIDGVEVDTGPSVLTLTSVFDRLFAEVGSRLEREVGLRKPDPAFRYLYPDGTVLDVKHDPEATARSVGQTLGPKAEAEFRGFLSYAQGIWDTAAPYFVYGPSPSLGTLMKPSLALKFGKVDPFRTMDQAMKARLSDERLRWLFARYATYNGSDPRVAPATLHCIAHVELSLGGYGVEGGIIEVVRAMERRCREKGVVFRFGARVTGLIVEGRAARGVVLEGGERISAGAVVMNGTPDHLVGDLLPRGTDAGLPAGAVPSMSGWTAIVKARRKGNRVAHHVVFPQVYSQEFADVFDRKAPPEDPTVYVCAQEACHGRRGWADHEPLFVMANAPPVTGGFSDWAPLKARVLSRLLASGLIEEGDSVVWERSPTDLARRFPGSQGSLYGASSNSMWAAFQRAPNRVEKIPGLYLASGGAHPGGGMPLCVQSGLLAAEAAAADLGGRR